MSVKGKNKKVEEMVETSLHNLNELVDVNTVIGKPIATSGGYQLIPVSKVTMGYLSGGGEYGEIKILKEDENYPFAGGSGAVVSLNPRDSFWIRAATAALSTWATRRSIISSTKRRN